MRQDLSHQGPWGGWTGNGVIYLGNLDTITTKQTGDCSVICILARDAGGRGPAITDSSLSLPSPWLLRRAGSREGWDTVLRLPGELHRSLQSSEHRARFVCRH